MPVARPDNFFDWPAGGQTTEAGADAARRLVADGLGHRGDMVITPLKHGASGMESFRVEEGGRTYYAKVWPSTAGVRRLSHECAWARWASERKLAPTVRACTEGGILTDFVGGAALPGLGARQSDALRRIFILLRQVHSQPIANVPDETVFHGADHARHALGVLRDSGRAPATLLRDLNERVASLERALSTHTVEAVPCHNDFHHNNLLDDGRLWLVDWSSAGLGDPYNDLARLACNLDIAIERAEEVLGHYQGTFSAEETRRLQLCMALLDLELYAWCAARPGREDDARYFLTRVDHDRAVISTWLAEPRTYP